VSSPVDCAGDEASDRLSAAGRARRTVAVRVLARQLLE